MAPRVLISDALSDTAVNIFKERGIEADFRPELGKDKDALLAAIGDYDGLAIRSATKVTAKLLDSITTAEHAIAMLLASARQLPAADASTRAGKWEKSRFVGVEVTGKTLGVIGCGNIGSIVADRACGLAMRVIAFDPFLSEERAMELGGGRHDERLLMCIVRHGEPRVAL